MKCRKTKKYILCMVLLFSFLLSGCLDSSAIEGNADGTQGESAPVEYRCISNPESKKKICVILKNYHGDYWEGVIKGVEKAAKEVDAAIYLGGIDNETDISGQIRLMNEAIEKVNIEKDGIKYSQASKDAVMVKYAAARKVKNNSGATEEQLEAAIKDLREALDNLEQLCKVTVDKRFTNDIKVTLTAEHAEYASENEDSAEFYVPLKEKVTVTTSEKDGNTPFSGWEMTVNNGGSSEDSGTKIVSNSTVYTFYVTGETHLEPVYGETDEKPAEEKIVLNCSTGYQTDSAYFLTKREIPKKYSVVEHGVVMTDERGWERYQNKEEGFVRGAALTKRSVAKRKGNSGIFKAKLKCEKNKVWYGRAYIIYTDGETTYTKYSEIIRYPQQ